MIRRSTRPAKYNNVPNSKIEIPSPKIAVTLKVVAEGVETDQQYAIVRRLGCDLVQGYFIARPMPADQLLNWVDGYEDTRSIKKASTVVGIDSKIQ